MKIVLDRGGNFKGQRFDASDSPQDVPDGFGRAMIGRGLAKEIKTPKKPAVSRRTAGIDGGDS